MILFIVKPLIYQFRSIVQTEGEKVTLECLSHGDPAPSITLRKSGQQRDYVIGENVIYLTMFTEFLDSTVHVVLNRRVKALILKPAQQVL